MERDRRKKIIAHQSKWFGDAYEYGERVERRMPAIFVWR